MDILSARFIFLLLYGLAEGNNPLIKWHILNPPIRFGDDIVLFCNTSVAENCCTNTATWMKGFDIIVHHGASIDSSKYTQKLHSDGFSLSITNFNEEDINHQYTCLYDFFSYSEVLKLNPNVMRYEPNKEEIKTNFSMSDNFIVAVVLIEMIYPSPECNFVVNGEMTATKVTIFEETRNRLFFKMKIHLECEINKTKCIDSLNVAISCSVGGDDIGIKENTTIYCSDTTTSNVSNEKSKEKTNSLPITLASILTLCIAVVIIVILWRNMENICKVKLLNIEGGGLQSTCSEMSCSMVCWRSSTFMSEESEMITLLPKHALSDTRITVNIIPAQKLKDFKIVLRYDIQNDKSYTQKLSNDTRIDIARRNTKTAENFNIFICSMTTSTSHRNGFSNYAKTKSIAESNRMIFRVILDFNAFVDGLSTKKRLKNIGFDINNVKDGYDINVGNSKPSLCFSVYRSSYDVKCSNSSSSPPAQKMKDIAKIVIYACLNDKRFVQGLATNIGINLVRCQSHISGLNYFTWFPPSTTRTRKTWVIAAQKVIDVIRIVSYFVLHDKLYIQILVTNTRINYAREQRPLGSKNQSLSSCVPAKLNVSVSVSDVDVLKCSLGTPTWGSRKRSRISITGKQES